jgi:hypothetical protein
MVAGSAKLSARHRSSRMQPANASARPGSPVVSMAPVPPDRIASTGSARVAAVPAPTAPPHAPSAERASLGGMASVAAVRPMGIRRVVDATRGRTPSAVAASVVPTACARRNRPKIDCPPPQHPHPSRLICHMLRMLPPARRLIARTGRHCRPYDGTASTAAAAGVSTRGRPHWSPA